MYEIKVAESARFALYVRTPRSACCCEICGEKIKHGEDTVTDGINHAHLDCLYGDMEG